MAQIFKRSTNILAKISVLGGVFILAGLAGIGYVLNASAYSTSQGVTIKQPVPFSHDHHVRGIGIDCRYCHTTVEKSSFAGIPPSATCMNCHKQIWKDAPMLEPVRESVRTGKPIAWTRVHDLPDFVYFDHSIHVNKGVGCASCHGRIDKMPLANQAETLQMKWCLDCHRHPETALRPKTEVTNMAWAAPDQKAKGAELAKEYDLRSTFALTNCSTCHR